ncbi:MAG: hypothetical protein U0Q12_28275 [Vicinamibacterales bacterium]
MPRIIQIRHVPDRVHLRLKAEAARQGMTLASHVLKTLERAIAVGAGRHRPRSVRATGATADSSMSRR